MAPTSRAKERPWREETLPLLPPLPRRFYNSDVLQVARELVGKVLVRQSTEGITAGRIVETEAYLARGDPANHAFSGPTKRNAVMFGPPGRAYVYRLHQVHCLNAVTEPEGVPSAVLIRAVEPVAGIELMRRRRRQNSLYLLARGPGRLCQAFAIDRSLNGWDLTKREEVWIVESPPRPVTIAVSPRVGVTAAQDLLLRFLSPTAPLSAVPELPLAVDPGQERCLYPLYSSVHLQPPWPSLCDLRSHLIHRIDNSATLGLVSGNPNRSRLEAEYLVRGMRFHMGRALEKHMLQRAAGDVKPPVWTKA